MKYTAGLASIVLLLAACGGDGLSRVSLAFSSYESTPVVVTDFSLGGSQLSLVPLVVDGRADQARPREGASRIDLSLSQNAGSTISLKAIWVELTTGQAWQGVVDIPTADLQKIDDDQAEIMPVFGPNGLLIVTSDTRPTDTEAAQAVDVAQLCATRDPEADQNFKSSPGSLPGLREVFQHSSRPAPTATTCPNP